ncbi:MAG: HAMP domain-containing protein, partial [Paenibacillus macerans]|nr:HAMP domain-containing protein [Paenibacillus macerans]
MLKINSSISRKFMLTFAALIVVSSLLFSVSFYYISMGIISQNVLPQFDKVLLTSTQDIYKRLDTNQAMQLMSGKENSRFAVESYLTKSAKEFHLNNAYLIQLQENGAAVIAANENSGMKAGDPLEIQAAMAETSDGEIHISELYSDRFGSHKTAFIAIPGSKAVLAIGLDATFIEQKRAEILQICIGITALVIGAGLLVAYFVSRRITKSIKKLVAVTEKMAGGDFRQAIEVAGHDEVAQLAASFRT